MDNEKVEEMIMPFYWCTLYFSFHSKPEQVAAVMFDVLKMFNPELADEVMTTYKQVVSLCNVLLDECLKALDGKMYIEFL